MDLSHTDFKNIRGHRVISISDVIDGKKQICYQVIVYGTYSEVMWPHKITDRKLATAIIEYADVVIRTGNPR